MRGQKASGIAREELFVVAAFPILADLHAEAAEAGVEETTDRLRVPAAVVGGEQDEVLRGRGFRLVDEETFDELEHEGSVISRLGRRG
jgi:hypothetical protein